MTDGYGSPGTFLRPPTLQGGLADPAAVEHALARAALYRLLAGAWLYPTAARLADLARAATTAAENPLLPELREPLAALAAAARGAEPAAAAEEHVFLFDRQVRCSPYEGAYGDGPQLAGKSAALADVAGFYAAFGLGPAEGRPDMEDHVGAELEFMSALALKEAWALGAGDAEGVAVTRHAQVAFLRDHLGRWAETFAGEVAAATPLPTYTAAAALLTIWIGAESDRLGAAPARVAGRLGHDPLQEDALTCPLSDAGRRPSGAAP